MEKRTSSTRIFFLLLSVFSAACSAASPNHVDAPTTFETQAKLASYCESESETCKQIKVAAMEVRALENKILKLSASAYSGYLADDPEYVKDIENYLADSELAWASYRDAQCELEPYISGMSRREMSNISEQCKLERTQHRIYELKGLLTTVKSNLE